MGKGWSRRSWLKGLGAAGVGFALADPAQLLSPRRAEAAAAPARAPQAAAAPAPSTVVAPPHPDGTILPLTSTSEVDIPAQGRGYMKFSFDFPEPSVAFGGLRFGFVVFTSENAYALDPDLLEAEVDGDAMTLRAGGLTWAGGQERAAGTLEARFRRDGDQTEWRVVAQMDQPIKAVKAIVRGVPRGQISISGNDFFDPRDGEALFGYPFNGGDLFGANTAGGMTTPLAVIEVSEQEYFWLSSRDDRVRTKRFYFQPGPEAYKVECVHEVEGWLKQSRVEVPPWRIGRAAAREQAERPHFDHLERAYGFPAFDDRTDVPTWVREASLALTLHGQHYTGYVFNDYARMLEILRWTAERIPPERVIAFIAAWDGRYYWDNPLYEADPRMGGEEGFRRLIAEGRSMGFAMMPMFGSNSANREQPVFAQMADAATHKIDGDRMDLNWVDWDNDRHQEGWLAYMNLGVDSWREWLTGRIAECIERYEPDAYFLDIIGGWTNNTAGDMHEGARRMVLELRRRHPDVICCGEMLYDALIEFIPLFHVYYPGYARHVRSFQHLSHAAPGRGSSGVHEWGFGRWDPETLSIRQAPNLIPTLSVVDDTFDRYRDEMEAVIARAKEWAGID